MDSCKSDTGWNLCVSLHQWARRQDGSHTIVPATTLMSNMVRSESLPPTEGWWHNWVLEQGS